MAASTTLSAVFAESRTGRSGSRSSTQARSKASRSSSRRGSAILRQSFRAPPLALGEIGFERHGDGERAYFRRHAVRFPLPDPPPRPRRVLSLPE
ncbi:MAG: hypothetical protein ACREC9_03275 [Methylocella sp.]